MFYRTAAIFYVKLINQILMIFIGTFRAKSAMFLWSKFSWMNKKNMEDLPLISYCGMVWASRACG